MFSFRITIGMRGESPSNVMSPGAIISATVFSKHGHGSSTLFSVIEQFSYKFFVE